MRYIIIERIVTEGESDENRYGTEDNRENRGSYVGLKISDLNFQQCETNRGRLPKWR